MHWFQEGYKFVNGTQHAQWLVQRVTILAAFVVRFGSETGNEG
jgi:hypothetical protein